MSYIPLGAGQIVSQVTITGQTTDQTMITYPVVANGLFVISGCFFITSGSGTVLIDIAFTDLGGSVSHYTITGASIGSVQSLLVKGGTNIVFTADVQSGSPTYTASGYVQQIN